MTSQEESYNDSFVKENNSANYDNDLYDPNDFIQNDDDGSSIHADNESNKEIKKNNRPISLRKRPISYEDETSNQYEEDYEDLVEIEEPVTTKTLSNGVPSEYTQNFGSKSTIENKNAQVTFKVPQFQGANENESNIVKHSINFFVEKAVKTQEDEKENKNINQVARAHSRPITAKLRVQQVQDEMLSDSGTTINTEKNKPNEQKLNQNGNITVINQQNGKFQVKINASNTKTQPAKQQVNAIPNKSKVQQILQSKRNFDLSKDKKNIILNSNQNIQSVRASTSTNVQCKTTTSAFRPSTSNTSRSRPYQQKTFTQNNQQNAIGQANKTASNFNSLMSSNNKKFITNRVIPNDGSHQQYQLVDKSAESNKLHHGDNGVREKLKQIIRNKRNASAHYTNRLTSQQQTKNTSSTGLRSSTQLGFNNPKQSAVSLRASNKLHSAIKSQKDPNEMNNENLYGNMRDSHGVQSDTYLATGGIVGSITQKRTFSGLNHSFQKMKSSTIRQSQTRFAGLSNEPTSAGMDMMSVMSSSNLRQRPGSANKNQLLKNNVKSLRISDYYNQNESKSGSLILGKDMSKMQEQLQRNTYSGTLSAIDKMLGMKAPEKEFPTQILDNIIQVEEQMYGFSLYNRGNNLKKSLIDPAKVKEFIKKHKNDNEVPSLKQSKDDWQSTLAYFKEHPEALLDAIPTPRDENGTMLDLKTGMTPKKDLMKFSNLNESMASFRQKNAGISTPRARQLPYSPKNNPLLSSRKLNLSNSKRLLLNENTLGRLHSSESRQSLRSPGGSNIMSRSFHKDKDIQKIYGNLNDVSNQSPARKNNFEKKDFRINKTQRDIQSAKSAHRIASATKRQSDQTSGQTYVHNANLRKQDGIKTKRMQLLEEQQKRMQERKQTQERLKSKIKQDYFNQGGSSTTIFNQQKGSTQQSRSILSGILDDQKFLIDNLDWKNTKIYKDYVIHHKNHKIQFEIDQKLLKEDEIEFIKSMVHNRLSDCMNQQMHESMNKLCSPYINKAYNTLEVILKELMGENNFMHEFDRLYLERHFQNNLYLKVIYLLDKLKAFFKFRDDAIEFLQKIHHREEILAEMKQTVMNIQSEKDIEEELGSISRHQMSTEQSKHQSIEENQAPTREKIAILGDRLVDITEEIHKNMKKFLVQFNKLLEFVCIQNFVFDDSDYENISLKEVREIKDIFMSFDIKIKDIPIVNIGIQAASFGINNNRKLNQKM